MAEQWTAEDVQGCAEALYRQWHGASVPFAERSYDVRAEYIAGAEAVLAVLADAGRLLPADAPVEWSVRFADGTVMDRNFTEEGARARAAEYTAAVADPAEPVWRRVGPWQPTQQVAANA